MIRTPINKWPSASDWRELPNSSGVYALVGTDGTILYIGESGNLHKRLMCHHLTRKLESPFRIAYFIVIAKGEGKRRNLESDLIRLHQPKYNRRRRQEPITDKDKTLAREIKLARVERDIRQCDFAQMAGVDVYRLNQIENAKRRPNPNDLHRIYQTLNAVPSVLNG